MESKRLFTQIREEDYKKPGNQRQPQHGVNPFAPYPYYPDEEHQKIAQLMEAINFNVVQQGQSMQKYVAAVNKRVECLGRKKKRSVVSRDIIVSATGQICLAEHYDDDSDSTYAPLMLNVRGAWNVYRIKFKKIDEPCSMFMIQFPESNHIVIGECRRVTESGLYNNFVDAGIVFSEKLKTQHIKESLFRKFSPLINKCDNTWTFPELAGWNFGKFYDATKMRLMNRADFPRMPIMEKTFTFIANAEKQYDPYFMSITNIKGWKPRAVMAVVPIIGIMSSILADEDIKNPYFLNLVLTEPSLKHRLMKMLQIFNREKNSVLRASMKDSSLRKELMKMNDEVIFVDAEVESGDVYYKKGRIAGNVSCISKKICEKGNSIFGINRNIDAVLVVFNSGRVLSRSAFNLYVGEDFFANVSEVDKALNENGFESFLTLFIRYAENDMDEIREIFRRVRGSRSHSNSVAWEASWLVYERFWKAQGIDIGRLLRLPERINWTWLMEDPFDPENLREVFIQGMRKHICKLKIARKNSQKIDEDTDCIYNDEFLWITTMDTKRILKSAGLEPYGTQILQALKESGELKTDSEGLSRRLQIAGKRKEAYQFKIHLFDVLGEPNIIDLAGGNDSGN